MAGSPAPFQKQHEALAVPNELSCGSLTWLFYVLNWFVSHSVVARCPVLSDSDTGQEVVVIHSEVE